MPTCSISGTTTSTNRIATTVPSHEMGAIRADSNARPTPSSPQPRDRDEPSDRGGSDGDDSHRSEDRPDKDDADERDRAGSEDHDDDLDESDEADEGQADRSDDDGGSEGRHRASD